MAILTDEQINLRAGELSSALNATVKPLVVKRKDGERIIGYYRQPRREAKMAAFDKVSQGQTTSAGSLLFEACIIREESDPRMVSDDPQYDDIYIGASLAMFEELNVATSDLGKK